MALPQRIPKPRPADHEQAVPPPPAIIRRLLAALDAWEPQGRAS
ncbi:hypothetical protein [Nocardia sp. XZ_19_231]|nr:hypothetical protein [Nocardia sp. XZ_19_231]